MTLSKEFEVIDYTSDVKIRAYGRNIEELFENSARGMFSLIGKNKKFRLNNIDKIFIIKIKGASYEELLVSWLENLLFYHETKKILFFDFKIISFFPDKNEADINPEYSLEAKASGERIDLKKHEILTHIKGPTYHNLNIIQDIKNEIFEVNIIFDV